MNRFDFCYALLLAAFLCPGLRAAQPVEETEFYPITLLATPGDTLFETGAIELLPDGKIAVSTRRGEIWVGSEAYTSDAPKWRLFARYLHEPLGLSWRDGWLYATQRPEVTRMKDKDGDGEADLFECVSDGWGINGDYHEYAFGTRHDAEGNIWVALCLTGSFTAESLYRGWVLRISPDGKVIPTVCGVRSPGGIGFGPRGEVFYCDNQGPWNGSSSLKHLKIGSFQGNPNGNIFFPFSNGAIGEAPPFPTLTETRIVKERERLPTYEPPAVILPHGKLGQSPTGIALIENEKFGPFQGQLLVGEQTFSQVQRVFLEEVNGVWQGAAFSFLNGCRSGTIAIRLAEDGTLFTGGSDRGWGARGGKQEAVERVRWTGKTPFEIKEMKARPTGFQLLLTEPVDPASAVDASFAMSAYTYIYRPAYGSPEVDALGPAVKVSGVSPDGFSIDLTVEPLTKGHVHELKVSGLRNKAGKGILHPTAYYTLNEIPTR